MGSITVIVHSHYVSCSRLVFLFFLSLFFFFLLFLMAQAYFITLGSVEICLCAQELSEVSNRMTLWRQRCAIKSN